MIKVVASEITDPFLIKDLLPCYCFLDREIATRNIVTNSTLSFSLITDSKLLGCIGAIECMPGVLGIWAVLSADIKEEGYAFHRLMKKMIKNALKSDNVKRIQVLVKAGNAPGIKQNEAFGLKREGLLRGVGENGEDMVMLAAIKGDF